MRIAICDDDMAMALRVENLVLKCRDMTDIDTEVYLSGEEILQALKEGHRFPIYILDVMMPAADGFDVAGTIRLKDENAIILFLTSNRDMMQKAFDVRAFHYLLKDVDDARIEDVLRRAIYSVNSRQSFFFYQKSFEKYTVKSGDIIYIESRYRKMRIVTVDGEDEFYDTMDSVMLRLNPLFFVRIHKSYIVNLEYVKMLNGSRLIMNTGEELHITQSFQSSFNDKYRSFIIRQMR